MARASTWQVQSCSSARLLGPAAACVLGFGCHAEAFGWQAFGSFKNYVDEQLDRRPRCLLFGARRTHLSLLNPCTRGS